VHDIDELQQHLLHVWQSLEQLPIDDAVDQWPIHLRACVHASGGHLNISCHCQFVFSVLDELCFSPNLMQWVIL